ncbi:glycosyltransferase family 9 protein [Massilia sp. P8910]|uniref:glycosyltransferase family 9 protein n=1 Tax=Massilia antarctica TaxID=2765360 RepID=UPI0006BE0E42|nr:glycosyltransferase family 9 protein [Massilia antarctica]MCY0913607.1 glycosyltransferase family 9 protein [Massilia sp. H27-R4]CUI06009.1 Glycosyl transferase, family 9 [Janthinobacterium sp. CG23_2]CUU29795.1 Glycosyl transferase, family 9 [Janthinobacterium sp. CG23_2]
MKSGQHARLARVRHIVVLRPNALGDFMFCLPALHALKHSYPEARLSYIGLPWHAAFLQGRPGPVDAVAVMPPYPGMGVGGQDDADPCAVEAFVENLRRSGIDLAVQLFGGGRHANPFIRRLGARLTVGMCAGDAEPLDRNVRHEGVVNRRLQLLEVAALAGAAAWPMRRELDVTGDDLAQAARLLPPARDGPLVLLQPGASDPRRRWPVRRFAALADVLVREGASVAVNGTEEEAPLVRELIGAMRRPAIDLSGKVSLGALCGIVARCALVVSNDTGPLHLALAIGTPAVGIYWLTNLIESAPLRQHGHRAAVSLRVHCPVCGEENIRTRCAHDASFVDVVTQDEVNALALGLLRDGRARDGRHAVTAAPGGYAAGSRFCG